MKREELKIYKLFGCKTSSSKFVDMYFKCEADAVMDEYEKHIKELEAKLKEKDEAMDTCRGLIESAGAMSKNAESKLLNSVKELEAKNRHQKYKRCLAMAEWCDAEADVADADGDYEDMRWYQTWHERWLELSKNFKPQPPSRAKENNDD